MKLIQKFSVNSVLSSALLISFLVSGPARSAPVLTEYEKACRKIAAEKGKRSDQKRLQAFFDLGWNHSMMDNPEAATFVGFPGQNGRWTDQSLAEIARRKRETDSEAMVLASIHPEKLDESMRASYEVYKYNTDRELKGREFPSEYLVMNQMGGVQSAIAEMMDSAPTFNVKDYEDILSRLRGGSKVIEQNMILLKEGLAHHVTPPKVTMTEVPNQILAQIKDDPMQAPVLVPFTRFPKDISEADRARLKAEAIKIYQEQLVPAFKSLHEFVVKEYLPGCREPIAFTSLPNGEKWYAHQVEGNTTTHMTPKEIHDLGLSEVARIQKEMDVVMRSTGFKGTRAQFNEFLRKDSKFYYSTSEELLSGYRDIAKRIDPELIKIFSKLPSIPYGVKAVPSYGEKSAPTAYYNEGSMKAGRPGYFFANTYDLKSRPKWEMETLTCHEAVPGHHLQISIAQEQQNVPEFRKHSFFTAYIEGWGLYAEGICEEIGMYKDPYQKYGNLNYELWRSIRLVVDTGMHAFGWSRQKAIDYALENSGNSEQDTKVEIDRYIVWPAQALAYKIGELKFKELRRFARHELGDRFDVRTFHDTLLGSGALPLSVLEDTVHPWVKKTAGVTSGSKLQ